MTDDLSKPPSSLPRKIGKGCLISVVVILIVTGGCMLLQSGFH
jgi:hypothetical protein